MADHSLPPAYVLWFGPTGLSVARALGRAGVPVVALHHDANEPCVNSRFARVVIKPPIDADERATLDWLLEEGRSLAPCKGVLIPASDAYWLFVARHRAVLETYFHVAMPRHGSPEAWIGKPFQYAAARRAGLKVPATILVEREADASAAAEAIGFPCLIKPVHSHLWQREFPSKLAFVRDIEHWRRWVREAFEHGVSVMAQEYIPAPDHEIYGAFLCVDRHSRPLGWCVSRKLRQHEPRFGNSCLSESVDEPMVVELALRLVRELGYHGICSAEFKRDPRDGEFKFMEINLRPTTLMAVAFRSGVNLALLSYRDSLGEPPPIAPVTTRGFGRRVGNIANDLHAARFHRRHEGLSMLAWLRSWIGARDVHFAWDDLGPFRGYLHAIKDHWRRGKYRELPANYPTPEVWAAGRWPIIRDAAMESTALSGHGPGPLVHTVAPPLAEVATVTT
jgi:D-aspartate ligase